MTVPGNRVATTHLIVDDQGVLVTDDPTVIELTPQTVSVSEVLALWGVADEATSVDVVDAVRGPHDVRVVLRTTMPSGRVLGVHLVAGPDASVDAVGAMGQVQHAYELLGVKVPRLLGSVNDRITEPVGDLLAYAQTWIEGATAHTLPPALAELVWEEMLHLEAQMCARGGLQVPRRTSWAFIDLDGADELDENDQVAHEYEPLLSDATGGDPRVFRLFASHHVRKADLSHAYLQLPEAAVQADIATSNAVVSSSGDLVGLIDFSLSGMERCANYLLMQCVEGPTDEGWTDEAEYAERDQIMRERFAIVAEHYRFSPAELAALPEIYRLRVPFMWSAHAQVLDAIAAGRAEEVLSWMERESSRPDDEVLALLGQG